jgi:zinc protease
VVAARGWSLGLALLIAAVACGPSPPPSPPRQTRLGLELSAFELSNGLRVVLVRDPKAIETQVTMRYGAGAVDDGETPGIAHLVEHLMFQFVVGDQTVFSHLEDTATLFNAMTTLDATTYFARAQPAHLERLLAFEAARLGFQCALIDDATFAREREVVIQELRQRDAPRELYAALLAALYPEGHPYRHAHHGRAEHASTITREQACAFAAAHYRPGNAVLVISGPLTPAETEPLLAKFFRRLPRRDPVAAVPLPRFTARRVSATAPVDEETLLIAWPMPENLEVRVKTSALASAVVAVVDQQIAGRVELLQLGDTRAPVLALAIAPGPTESYDDALAGVQRGLDALPDILARTRISSLGQLAFDRIRQSAIYGVYAELDDAATRDIRLAADLLGGRDPRVSLASEFKGLRELTQPDAARIAAEQFTLARATVARLRPLEGAKKLGRDVTPRAAIHDPGQRRGLALADEAFQPAKLPIPSRDALGARIRKLDNGLQIVLLPMTSVPTVDIRLVFAAGTADEPAGKRGVALLAAHALDWDPRYLTDLMRFVASGGTIDTAVHGDHTTFVVRGVDMHLDLLLAGLRRWIREGTYDDADDFVEALRTRSKRIDDTGAITDAWRAALYGKDHPYVHGGLLRHASDRLASADVGRFRAAHYTPDNATLVIAGQFDVALANRWIDYLFADWTGRVATPRASRPASPSPAALAKVEDLAQVLLQIGFPSRSTDRARQLVAAAMLLEIAGDARHQLGATYGLDGGLDEARQAASYRLAGWIDPERAGEIVALLRERIGQLRSEPDIASRAFVTARNRVLVQLSSVAGSASVLASRVERDVSMGRWPISDLLTALEVQRLTLEDMGATLAELDLSRAVVLARGPADGVRRVFDEIGATPTEIRVDHVAADAADDDPPEAHPRPGARRDRDLEIDSGYALTTPGIINRIALALHVNYTSGSVDEPDNQYQYSDTTGTTFAAEVGYRITPNHAVGFHVATGTLTGTSRMGLGLTEALEVVPVDLALFLQGRGLGRFWGGALIGFHFDRVRLGDREGHWRAGLGVGLEAGLDVVQWRGHGLGLGGRVRGVLGSPTGYGELTLGLTYRR